MAMENDVLNKISELEAAKDIAGLEDIKMTAEAGFEGDIAGAAEQAILRLSGKAVEVSATSHAQEQQIENLGGNTSELNKRTETVDNQIKTIETEAEQQIGEVEKTGKSENTTTPEKPKVINVEELKGKILELNQKTLTNAVGLTQYDKVAIYDSLGKKEEAKEMRIFMAKDFEDTSKSPQASGFHASQAAKFYEEAGDQEKAKEMYQKSISQIEAHIDTNKPELAIGDYFHLSNLYPKLGENNKSLEMARKLVEMNERAVGSEKNYGAAAISYEKLGDNQNAKKMWEAEAERWGNAKAENAAEAYAKAGNKEKAEEFYKKAIAYQEDLKQRNSMAFDSRRLAKAYAGIGQKEKAIAMLSERVEEMDKGGALLGAFKEGEVLKEYL